MDCDIQTNNQNQYEITQFFSETQNLLLNIYRYNKYYNGKIYCIMCNTTGEVYIGSTTRTLNKRLKDHKSKDNGTSSKQIILRGDYKMILLENYPCANKRLLEQREAEWIKSNECVNEKVPFRTEEEAHEIKLQSGRNWRINNREHHNKYMNDYFHKNKVSGENKGYFKKYYKKYNEESPNIQCICGSVIKKIN